ncbi:C39 family peptidase [Patescibacteria group bacterium]|nr:C39 family peptidase [Patescibacteria group bacterium]MBU1890489.1 C39 family peptidase [Patescibacteria group bacterium]
MMRKLIIIVLILIGTASAYWFRVPINDLFDELNNPALPEPVTFVQINENSNIEPGETNASTNNSNEAPEPTSLPDEINLAVPFTSQAPHANWDLPYQEACEEAAALMVHRYWSDEPFSSKEDADTAILELIDFQNERYGSYEDTTAQETVQLIKDIWGYKSVDLYTGNDVTLDRIKQELSNGYPVIVMAAGRELGNPNYKQPGPLYHALVLKGYLSNGDIITNDSGTRNGADYTYTPSILLDAIHDWNNGDVPSGQRNMIIIRPNN